MEIAVLGAGAMGSVFGARLALGGADVTLLDVNDAHLEQIQTNGLEMYLDEGTRRVQMAAMRPEAYSGSPDVVLLFTKTFHTDAALASIAKVLENGSVLTLQNGIGNAERVAAHVSADRVLMGMTMTPAEFLGPGRVASHGPAQTSMFSLNGEHSPLLTALVDAMKAGGIDAKADPNIQAAIWEKASFNCSMNALCALTDGTPGSIGVSEDGRKLASRVAAECIATAKAGGIDADLNKVEALMTHACAHHLYHDASMLQDRRAGRKTEIDALNGAVTRIAADLNVPVPINETLTALIRLTERSQRFRSDQDKNR